MNRNLLLRPDSVRALRELAAELEHVEHELTEIFRLDGDAEQDSGLLLTTGEGRHLFAVAEFADAARHRLRLLLREVPPEVWRQAYPAPEIDADLDPDAVAMRSPAGLVFTPDDFAAPATEALLETATARTEGGA